MKTFRIVAILAVLALVMVLVPASMAQDQTFGLSEADFQLFGQSTAATFASSSATFDFTIALNAGDTATGMSANLTGHGSYGTQALQLSISGDAVSAGQSTPMNFELRLVDGVIYFTDGTSGWQGATMEDLTAQLGQQFGSLLPFNPGSMSTDQMMSDPAMMEAMTAIQEASAQINPADFIAMSRADENGLAHFSVDLKVADFLNSEAFQSLMVAAMQMGASSAAGAAGSDASTMMQQAQGSIAMAGMLLQDSSFTFDTYVNTTDSRMERAVFDMVINIDPAMFGSEGEATAVTFNFDINFSGFGEPVSIVAPEGATMMPSAAGQ